MNDLIVTEHLERALATAFAQDNIVVRHAAYISESEVSIDDRIAFPPGKCVKITVEWADIPMDDRKIVESL